ncbi:hypothetical protein, partial [uncultured Phascolarctobacterium sp.]|uniref:hypothetical protein n=1 Tax=uncultured Phascolarctobacterium sp. TaxID=512296 RepID=UPI0025F0610B
LQYNRKKLHPLGAFYNILYSLCGNTSYTAQLFFLLNTHQMQNPAGHKAAGLCIFLHTTQKASVCRRTPFTFFDEYEYIMKRSQVLD